MYRPKLNRILNWINFAMLRLCVLVRDLDYRHLRLLLHSLRNGGWASIKNELLPEHTFDSNFPKLSRATYAVKSLKKNILVIDRSLPRLDRDAGSRASWQYIQLLCEMGYSVTVMGHDCLRREPYAARLEQMGVQVLSGWAIACGRWRDWVRSNAGRLDFILLHRPNVAITYLDFLLQESNARILYFGEDLRWLRNQRRHKLEGANLHRDEALYWRSIENKIIGLAHCSYFYSKFEVEMAVQEMPQAIIRALPLFLYTDKNLDHPPFNARTGLLFVGGFAHQPNADGIIWFVNTIFPLVLKKIGHITLKIVGENPPPELFNRPDLELLGAISDAELAALYRSSKIAVAPLRYGAGVKGKVVEALFHQIPLVTTGIGAEGLPSPNEVMDVCDEPLAFAQRISSLYSDSDEWVHRSRKIKAYLELNFSPAVAYQILEEGMSVA